MNYYFINPIALFLFFLCIEKKEALAQYSTISGFQTNYTSGLNIKNNSQTDQLFQAYINDLQNKHTTAGFRIQLIQDSNRENARKEKAAFLNKFPDIEVYETYEAPFFKIRVGDFKTRIAAYRLFQNCKPFFKKAFIVNEIINITPKN